MYITWGQKTLYRFGFFLECTLFTVRLVGCSGQFAECFFFLFIAFVVGTQGSLLCGLFYSSAVCGIQVLYAALFFLFGEGALKVTCQKCGLSFVFLHPLRTERTSAIK